MRADADAGVGDHDVRGAEAADEVARRIGERALIRDIERVMDDGAGEPARRRPAGNQPEHPAGRSVMARQRLTDARGGAGDDDALRCYLPLLRERSTRYETVSSMPSRLPPCSALTV